MGDPLSVLASIGGLIAIGTSLVTGLTTTISKARSAPASIQALSKELKTLCTALSNLETVFKLPDVLRNPLFPVDILSELLENIMADFVAVQKEVGSYTARPEAGALQQVWRQFRWSFREGDVRELRDDIAAYKATIVMTISAANFATTCSSALANSVEFSTLQASISELRANLSYCTHVNQCLRSSCTAIRSRCCSRARSQDNRRQSQHSAISRSSSQRTPRQQNVQHSATSDERSGTISGSLRSMKTFLTRSTSGSGSYSYRAESILDLYCASIRSMRQASIRQLDRALGPEVERGPEWNEDLNGQLHSDGDGDGTLYPNLQFNNDPQQQRGDGYESVFVMDPSPHSTELSGNAVVADPPLSQPQPRNKQPLMIGESSYSAVPALHNGLGTTYLQGPGNERHKQTLAAVGRYFGAEVTTKRSDSTFFMRVSELDRLSHSIHPDGGLIALLREVCRGQGWLGSRGRQSVVFDLWLFEHYIAAGDMTQDIREGSLGFMRNAWTENVLRYFMREVRPFLGNVIRNRESLNSFRRVSSLLEARRGNGVKVN